MRKNKINFQFVVSIDNVYKILNYTKNNKQKKFI